MKNTCWKLFSYSTIDHQAAQAFLNEMAAKGWALDGLVLNLFARFRRTERTDLSYYLDWADPKQVEDPDYIRICAESGWYIRDELGYWNLYESRSGFSPAPIQTDPELEYQRFRKKTLRRAVINGAVSGGFLLLFWGFLYALLREVPTRFDLEQFVLDILSQDIFFTFALAVLPFLAAGALLHLGRQLRRIWVWKKTLERGEVPLFSRQTAEVWRWVNLLSLCAAALLFLCCLADALVNGDSNWPTPTAVVVVGRWAMSGSKPYQKTRFQIGLLSVILGISLLAAMGLHGPFREIFPGRFPAESVVGDVLAEEQILTLTDAPFGSRKWGTGYSPELGRHWYDLRTWTIPGLARRAAEKTVQEYGMLPMAGRDGVWVQENRYLFLRENILLELLLPGNGEPPYEKIQAWMDGIQ